MADVLRAIFLSLILLFSLPAAAQDMAALFRQGMEAVEKGDHDTAIESFRKMLVEDPEAGAGPSRIGLRTFYPEGG